MMIDEESRMVQIGMGNTASVNTTCKDSVGGISLGGLQILVKMAHTFK
jgi:hypothetical protein